MRVRRNERGRNEERDAIAAKSEIKNDTRNYFGKVKFTGLGSVNHHGLGLLVRSPVQPLPSALESWHRILGVS